MVINAIKLFGWQIVRMGFQAIWAIALARALGPSGYGLFAGLAGLATTFGSISGLGFGLLLLQNASRTPQKLGGLLSNALLSVLISGLLLSVLFCIFSQQIGDHSMPTGILLAIAVPELLCLPIILISSYAFQSHERMGWAGAMYALGPTGNLLALSMFSIFSSQTTLEAYLQWHGWTALLACISSVSICFFVLKPGAVKPKIKMTEAREAIGFTTLRAIDTSLSSIDKTIVLKLAGSEVAGQYTAAFRLAALISLPAISVAISATPRLFRSEGSEDRKPVIQKLFIISALLLFLGIPASMLGSMAIPYIFGKDFITASDLSKNMVLLPGLLGLSSIGCTALMAFGAKKLRIYIQTLCLFLLVFLMYTLIPSMGLSGSSTSIQITYLTLAISSWWIIGNQIKVGAKN